MFSCLLYSLLLSNSKITVMGAMCISKGFNNTKCGVCLWENFHTPFYTSFQELANFPNVQMPLKPCGSLVGAAVGKLFFRCPLSLVVV